MNVSVIMPVYNEEKYIEYAINSFLEQEINEKELICVDDGSTDNSIKIISEISKKYNNVRLFKRKNHGSGKARNIGLNNAKGKYVCFLDADDFFIDKQALLKMFEMAEKYKVKVCGAMLQAYSNKEFRRDNTLRQLLIEKGEGIILYEKCQIDYQFYCFLFKKEFLLHSKIRFPDLWRFQDPPFLVQVLYHAKEFALIDVELYGYRKGHKSINWTDDKVFDLMKGLLFNLKFAYKHNLRSLFDNTLKRINTEYLNILYQGITLKNKKLLKLMLEANEIAEIEDKTINAIDYLISNKKQYSQIDLNNSIFKNHLEKILKKDVTIILYGAGNIGIRCFNLIKETDYANIILWVDLYKAGKIESGHLLSDVNEIKGVNFDNILIAIDDNSISSQVKSQLLFIGVSANKIIEWAHM